jgi:hypothetical protein
VAEQVFQDANLEYSKSYSAEIEGFVFKVIIIISYSIKGHFQIKANMAILYCFEKAKWVIM